jgi:hypothetical protein
MRVKEAIHAKKQAENGGAKRGLFVLDIHDFGTKQSASNF